MRTKILEETINEMNVNYLLNFLDSHLGKANHQESTADLRTIVSFQREFLKNRELSFHNYKAEASMNYFIIVRCIGKAIEHYKFDIPKQNKEKYIKQ